MTNTIDWTEPLELEDGTPVEIVESHCDGDRLLRRTDGNWFTREQAPKGDGHPQPMAIWHEDGGRYLGHPGLRVRNRIEQPAASTAADVPDWAIEKALPVTSGWTVAKVREQAAKAGTPFALVVLELARRIAASDPEPVDPDLGKAREICARVAGASGDDDIADDYRSGRCDFAPDLQFALSALKEAREQK